MMWFVIIMIGLIAIGMAMGGSSRKPPGPYTLPPRPRNDDDFWLK